jgi:acetyl esterase/lipase
MKLFYQLLIIAFPFIVSAQDSAYTRTEIIYGRKDGMALTMIELKPTLHSNGKAIISLVSGNWVSSYNSLPYYIAGATGYVSRGFTVFMVMHGSQPRYTLPDEIADVKRSVRFVRYHAADYGIDPAHIGITGSSSGGHLSLMVATADDDRDLKSRDSVDHVSARVQAAAVFFPPTDFPHFGFPFFDSTTEKILPAANFVAAAFDFKTLNPVTRLYVPVSDSVRLAYVKQLSPIYQVTSDDPPTFIIHGDADRIVPIQQSKSMIAKLNEANVPNKLIIVPGKGHGWADPSAELKQFADWFEKYLK